MKGNRHQKIGRKRYPLRKIVKTKRDEHGLVVEVLECGHEQRPVQDFIGETNAARRRCRRCSTEQSGSDAVSIKSYHGSIEAAQAAEDHILYD